MSNFEIYPAVVGVGKEVVFLGKFVWYVAQLNSKILWAVEGGLQVKFANVKRGELGAGAREDAVENELGKFKGCCRNADVSGKGDAISADGNARAVGIALLWADIANHFGVSNFLSAVGGDIFEANDEEGVSSLDTLVSAIGRGADALSDPAEFV